jgi:flagellar hook-basal body complex protein FliE
MSNFNFSLSKPIAPSIEMVKPVEPLAPAGQAVEAGGSFANIFNSAIDNIKSTRATADRQLEAWMNGEDVDIHQIATSVQKADITFELALEVRNKAMQAYQEIMRMQI